MRLLALLAFVLAASTALAQSAITRGGALKKREYQTYSTLTYYVDPTGNDSNACTAPGTSACATLYGALQKLPFRLRHNVTINLAAGAAGSFLYTDGITIERDVTLAITGTLSTFTPATGTASGTTTASTAGGSSGPATVTDASQTWTVNDLRGRFIRFNSGTLSGQAYPIIENTATTVTFPSTSTAGVGVSYDIVTPGTTLTHSATQTWGGVKSAGIVSFSNLDVTRTGSGVALFIVGSTGRFFFTNVRAVAPSGSAVRVAAGTISLTRSWIEAHSTTATALICSTTSDAGRDDPPFCVASSSALAAPSGQAVFISGEVLGSSFGSAVYFEGAGTSIPVFRHSGVASSQNPAIWVKCTTPTGSTGIGTSVTSTTFAPPASRFTNNGISRITGCEVGMHVEGGSWTTLSPTFDACTTAIKVTQGGRIHLFGTPTFFGVTNELQLDGENFTYSTLTSLTPKVISNSYGSTIIAQ